MGFLSDLFDVAMDSLERSSVEASRTLDKYERKLNKNNVNSQEKMDRINEARSNVIARQDAINTLREMKDNYMNSKG